MNVLAAICLAAAASAALPAPPLPYPADFAPAVAAVQNGDQKQKRFVAYDARGRGIAAIVGKKDAEWFQVAPAGVDIPEGAAFEPSGDQHLILSGGGMEKLLGNLSFTAAACASLEAAEAVKLLLGIGEHTGGRLIEADLLTMRFDEVELA